MNEKPEALRWDVGDESSPGMCTHPDGDWVRYADYKSLHAEIERLREQIKDCDGTIEALQSAVARAAQKVLAGT